MTLSPILQDKIVKLVAKEHPKVICGFLLKKDEDIVFKQMKNYSSTNAEFLIRPSMYKKYDKDIVGILHSHPNKSVIPSLQDRCLCNSIQIDYIIVSFPLVDFYHLKPLSYKFSHLIGRPFIHNVLDCYSVIVDYYKFELGIELLNIFRLGYWYDEVGNDLYDKNYKKAGFIRFEDFSLLKKNDIVTMTFNNSFPTHGAVYLGDDKILHHLSNQLSGRDSLSRWATKCKYFYRYKDL